MTASFVLTGPTGTLSGRGVRLGFSDITAARHALDTGQAAIVLGALPFDLRDPCALFTPETLDDALPDTPQRPLPELVSADPVPDPATHRARVARAIARLAAPGSDLHKVVLARALRLTADGAWDAPTILARLRAADPGANAYLVDLSAAGPRYAGSVLIGASPELLVARTGDRVTCRPFAGSAPRSSDPEVDRANGQALAESAKNRREHELVIEVMRSALEPLCRNIDIAPEPTVHQTDALWHLNTPISATLRETSTTALDLAVALHPTPAVGGVPTSAAIDAIREIEGSRGFYAGAAGWCDAAGDGQWVVSIRCAMLAADGRTALAHAGGGIVAESNPDDELDETTTKFRTILHGLDVSTEGDQL